MYKEKYILSMTTVPCRKKGVVKSIESLLKQSFNDFYKICINIDDYMSSDDYNFYFQLKELDERIEVNICDKKWRSCNKLIPTLIKYPNDVIITVDDDIYYPEHAILKLIEKYIENKDCIISHAVAPILTSDKKFIKILNNSPDVKLEQKQYGKYLSCCCLFPPHVFDNTDIFNYNKMFELTEGTHDELWFWINTVIKGVKCIGLKYLYEITGTYCIWGASEGDYALCVTNREKWDFFDKKIIEMYGEKINEAISKEKVEFKLTCDNIYSFLFQLDTFNECYKENYKINTDELDMSYKWLLSQYITELEK